MNETPVEVVAAVLRQAPRDWAVDEDTTDNLYTYTAKAVLKALDK